MADNSGGGGGGALTDAYALSSELLTDGEPVRCVSSIPSRSSILSGSQGGVVSRLALGGDGNGGGGPELQVQPGGPETRHPHQIAAILSSSSAYSAGGGGDPLGVYATGCRDGIVRVMDANTHELMYSLEGHTNAVTCVDFSPSGGYLASSSADLSVKIWSVGDGEYACVRTLRGHDHTVSAVRFVPPEVGDVFLDGGRGKATGADAGAGGGGGGGVDLAGCGSRFVVTASRDQTVKFW